MTLFQQMKKQGFKKVKLKDMIDKDVDGLLANVVSQGSFYKYEYQEKPKIRRLKKVEIVKDRGQKMLHWSWYPEPGKSERNYDCGYSGFDVTAEFWPFEKMYIYVKGFKNA